MEMLFAKIIGLGIIMALTILKTVKTTEFVANLSLAGLKDWEEGNHHPARNGVFS